MTLPRGSVLFAVWTVIVLAAVGTGLFVLGSPGDERARRIDDRRVTDLQSIAAATDLYWSRHSRLPTSLEELSDEPGVGIATADPQSGEVYGYQPLDSLRYEVCASFDRASEEMTQRAPSSIWAHGAGRQCFQLQAEEIARTPVSVRRP